MGTLLYQLPPQLQPSGRIGSISPLHMAFHPPFLSCVAMVSPSAIVVDGELHVLVQQEARASDVPVGQTFEVREVRWSVVMPMLVSMSC